MPVNGEIKNIALPPIGNRDLDPKETFVPFNVELRNGRSTSIGNWESRNGYGDAIDLSNGVPVISLIPKLNGIAITNDGNIYKDITTTTVQVSGVSLSAKFRPQWKDFDSEILIVDGEESVKISGGVSFDMGFNISPRYIGRVGAYTLYAGYDDTEFTWSSANSPTNITTGDSGTTNVKKDGIIKYATDFREKWYAFKDNSIEVWHNRGGSTPFVRLNELTIPIGLGASYSVVEANQTLYWMDNDRKFRVLNGANAQIISGQYESYIFNKITDPDNVYGIKFEKESVIRWFSPNDKICLVHDYKNNNWSEDNELCKGNFIEMPINSYMELNGEGYMGDLNNTGLVYRWSDDFKSDNDKEIGMLRKFRVRLTETDNKASVNQLRFMFKRGKGLNGSKAQAWLNIRIDDSPYSETRIIDLGTINDKNPDVTFNKLGTGRQMEIELWMTDAADFLLTGAKLTTKEMGR